MINLSPGFITPNHASLSLVKFLLPLDNDALALPQTLGLIDRVCCQGALAHEIVAVDDASTDATAAEARRFARLVPLWLIQHRRRMGRSLTFRTALEAACRDACEDDLLLPLDPRSRPDPEAVLAVIAAARAGWEMVTAPPGRESWRARVEGKTEPVIAYRAGLMMKHMAGFLRTPPRGDTEAPRELEQYLRAAGVRMHALPAPLPRQSVLTALPDRGVPVPSSGERGRYEWLDHRCHG